MHNRKIKILDVSFNNIDSQECINSIMRNVTANEKKFIVTANPEIIVRTCEDSNYKSVIDKADYILADGIGVILASKMKKTPIVERIAGFDLMTTLLEKADKNRMSCFFFGADPETNHKLIATMKKDYPNINIVGFQHGYVDLAAEELVAKEIVKKKPDFVFVALGAPKQEFWIAKYLNQFDKGIFMGVGGSFDVLSGKVKRAPNLWIRWHLEWLYRIIVDTKRIKRLPKLFKFIILIIRNKLK